MLKKEFELLVPFIKEPWKKFTFKDVKKLCKKTSASYVYNALKGFVKKTLLKEEKAGNVILYSLDLSKLKTQTFIGFISEYITWNKTYIPFDNLQKIATKMPTNFFIFIITGSYAKNRQTEKSDIDVTIVADDSSETKKIYAELSFACEMNIPSIHLYVFKKSEFLGMLLNKEANYGKAIAQNNLLVYGGPEYYRIMNEAIENGFNDKNLS